MIDRPETPLRVDTDGVTLPIGPVPRYAMSDCWGRPAGVVAICTLDDSHEGFLSGRVSCHGSTYELNLCADCLQDLYDGSVWCPDCGGSPVLRQVRLIADQDGADPDGDARDAAKIAVSVPQQRWSPPLADRGLFRS